MKVFRAHENIFRFQVDAIVNPANERLLEGGGLCGAIFDKVRRDGGEDAHRQLTEACRVIKRCPTGEAVVTPSFGLLVPRIIHAVGPRWTGRNPLPIGATLTPTESRHLKQLESVYCSVLHLCEHEGIRTVAIPSISTGLYNFPKELAAAVAVAVCESHDMDMYVYLVANDPVAADYLKNAPTQHAVDWVRSAV